MDKVDQEKMVEQIIDFRVFMQETIIYRTEQDRRMKELIFDVKDIVKRLQNLPCKERAYIPEQLRAVWAFIGAISLALIIQWIKRGG